MVWQISSDLILKPLKLSDAPLILDLVNASRKRLAQYLYWVDSVQDLVSCEQYIRERAESGLAGATWFKIEYHNKVCGVFAIKSISGDEGVAELGYWLAERYHGNGIISSILAALPDYLRQNSKAKIVEICCLNENNASIKLAIKIGGKQVNVINNYYFCDEKMQDLLVYRVSLNDIIIK